MKVYIDAKFSNGIKIAIVYAETKFHMMPSFLISCVILLITSRSNVESRQACDATERAIPV
jgi:hypothetical protein